MTIKFNKYHIIDTDTKVKARAKYIACGRIDGRRSVRVYARDYDDNLGKIFGNLYKNETDILTDYFEKGHVTFFEDSPFYLDALKQVKTPLTEARK
jgi:hypothetical protein